MYGKVPRMSLFLHLCHVPSHTCYFKVHMGMELYRGQRDLRLIQEQMTADNAEFRTNLERLVTNVDTILGTKSPETVEGIMSSLQTASYINITWTNSGSFPLYSNFTILISRRIRKKLSKMHYGNSIRVLRNYHPSRI
jgi:hypothetical protein